MKEEGAVVFISRYRWLYMFLACMFFLSQGRVVFGFDVHDLKTPESFIYDAQTASYFISNINGFPSEKDGNGFITRLNRLGEITAMDFISSGNVKLNAPKGMVIVGETLYVTDIDTVKSYNKRTGAFQKEFPLKKSIFLNDITVNREGVLYITDTARNSIYRLIPESGKSSVYIEDETLSGPNGLAFDASGTLFVASWNSGIILKIEDGRPVRLPVTALKNLDGLDFDSEGNLYVSDFTSGLICRITKNNKVSIILRGLASPADINIDRKSNLLMIPLFKKNSAMTFALELSLVE